MNGRTIELMNEANKVVGFTGNVEELAKVQHLMEKFAELIVRECIRRCEGNGEYKNHTDTDWGKGLAAGVEMCKTIIQTTFRS